MGLAAGLAGCTGEGNQDGTPTDGGGQTTTDGGQAASGYIQPGNTGSEVHLLTDYTGEVWQTLWEDLAAGVNDEHGVSVNAELVGMAGTGVNRLTTLLQAGNPPESFTGGTATAGNDSLAGQGDLAAVNHVIDRITDNVGDLIGFSKRYRDGDVYIVPHGLYTGPMTYRQDVLEDLGLDVPTTLEKRLHNARVIDESEDHTIRGDSIAAQKTGKSISDFQDVISAHGAWTFRWKTDEREETEVWFPKEEVVASLEYMNDLAEYGPDPSSITWGPWLQFWTGDRIAQGTFLNAWPAGVAAQAGNETIARGTKVDIVPRKEGVEPFAPQLPGFDGHSAIKPADNVPGLFTFLIYMYDNPERAAPYYTRGDPARFLPAYSDIMESDAFQEGGIYADYPSILDEMIKCRDEIAPNQISAEEYPETTITLYARGFSIIEEMVNQVVVTGRDPEKAWEDARDRLETRLQEGKNKFGNG